MFSELVVYFGDVEWLGFKTLGQGINLTGVFGLSSASVMLLSNLYC